MPDMKEINCPRCEAPNTWRKDNPFRPFCSERCKMIDLGDWAAEKHRIAGEPAKDDEKKQEDEDLS